MRPDARGPTDDDASRGPLRLLGDRNFGPYMCAQLGAAIGLWVYNVVAAIVVFNLTGSSFMVGLVSILMFTPQLVVTPLAGAQADRGSQTHQLALGRVIAAVSAGGLAVWTGLVGLDAEADAWLVIGAGLLVGLGFAMSGPAMHALLPALVRPSELSGAVALSQAPFTVARAVGPAIGAGLLARVGPAVPFAFLAVTNGVYAVVALRVRLRPVERLNNMDRSVRAGLRHLRADPVVGCLLGAVAASGFGMDPVITLTPSIAEQLGGGEALVGAMTSAFGAAAAISALLSGAVRRWVSVPRLAPAGFGAFAMGLTILAVAWTPAWAVSSLVVAGSGMIFAVTSLTTQLQARVPEHLRGRVMALWMVCFVGSRPIAAAINGSVADAVSVELALSISVLVLLLGAVASKAPTGAGS